MSSKNKTTIDYSGSCAIIILIINTTCYAINLGDSRAIYSSDGGNRLYQLTRDHKPNDSLEYKRIVQGGGSIYQTPGIGLGITLPYRIIPGKLSVNIFYNQVARAIGDIEAKLPQYGGNPNVLIGLPCVTEFQLDDSSDFIVMGCKLFIINDYYFIV